MNEPIVGDRRASVLERNIATVRRELLGKCYEEEGCGTSG